MIAAGSGRQHGENYPAGRTDPGRRQRTKIVLFFEKRREINVFYAMATTGKPLAN